jgi:hypothetical protein
MAIKESLFASALALALACDWVEGTREMSGSPRTTRKSMHRSRDIFGFLDLVTDRGQELQ